MSCFTIEVLCLVTSNVCPYNVCNKPKSTDDPRTREYRDNI